MKITIKQVIAYIICLTIVASFAWYLLYSSSEPLRVCEERGWDGSEYNTGVKDIKLFEESDDIIVKCTKEPNETDAIIDVLDELPFVKIKRDVSTRKRE